VSSSVGSRTGSNSTHSRRPSKCRVTLETLGDRLDPGEAGDLAAQLPEEIGLHFTRSDEAESFGWQEFVDRVAEDEGLSADDRGDAAYYAQVVVDLVAEFVSPGELDDVVAQLPEDEFDDLFELVDEDQLPA
jgi:uncharacterized protein (DUF2267 family)